MKRILWLAVGLWLVVGTWTGCGENEDARGSEHEFTREELRFLYQREHILRERLQNYIDNVMGGQSDEARVVLERLRKIDAYGMPPDVTSYYLPRVDTLYRADTIVRRDTILVEIGTRGVASRQAAPKNRYIRLAAELEKALVSLRERGINLYRGNDFVLLRVPENMLFVDGRRTISGSGERTIRELVEVLRPIDSLMVEVTGHTDNRNATSEQRASWENSVLRAVAIVREMQETGFPPTRMIAAGRGKYVPLGDNNLDGGRYLNRRTDFLLRLVE